MPTQQVVGSLTFAMPGVGEVYTNEVPGAELFRWVCPALPQSKGIIVRSISGSVGDRVGVPKGVFDFQKGTTSLLSSTVSTSTTGNLTFTLAGDGSEVFDAGDVLTIDLTAGASASTWSTSSALGQVNLQVNYDWR